MKIVVVMTYFERQFQLARTLLSLNDSKAYFEVVIMDDGSRDEIIIPDNLRFNTYPLRMCRKSWTNPEPVYNSGIKHALTLNPDVIVLQNAECYHIGDVLKYAERVTNKNYLSFGCFSLSKESTFNNLLPVNSIGASRDGQDAWYNHSVYRPVGYDFCAAITTENLLKLNGYDERLSYGCGYGDDYLLARVKMLGLNVEIVNYPYVAHQWHYNCPVPENKGELVAKNKSLYCELLKENNYRAEHLITQDL